MSRRYWSYVFICLLVGLIAVAPGQIGCAHWWALAHASVVQSPNSPAGRLHGKLVLCGPRDQELTGGGRLLVRNNVYQPGVSQCVRVLPGGFAVTLSQRAGVGVVGAFPDVTYGCDMWGACSRHSALPLPVWAVRDVMITVKTRFAGCPQAGTDTSDIWFTDGTADGPAGNRAELLIVLDRCHAGRFPAEAVVRACRRSWALNWWTTGSGADTWPLLRARPLYGHLRALHDCRIGPVLRFYERRGLIRPGWVLMSADWGFECWRACARDVVRGFWPTVFTVPVIKPLDGLRR